MIEHQIGKLFDKLFARIAMMYSPHRNEKEVAEYFDRLALDFEKDRNLLEFSFGLFSAIDTKASALLTHISILIAVAAILFNDKKGLFKIFLGVELLAFLMAALFCIRCIRFALPRIDESMSQQQQAYFEVMKRRGFYTLASDTTILATIPLMVAIVMDAVGLLNAL